MSLTRPLPGRAFLQGATALAVLSSVASGATRRNLATGKEGMVLVGVGLAEYRAEFAAALSALPPQPVILGHSMGAVLAQQLAASGLGHALILVSPALCAGILPSSDSERDLSQSLMGIPSFWKTVINPDFDLAGFYSLNRVPKDE